jgi:hypothetical protein
VCVCVYIQPVTAAPSGAFDSSAAERLQKRAEMRGNKKGENL